MDSGKQSASDILQATTAIAAVAIALATLADDHGPHIGSLEVFSTLLLFGGFMAVASSLYAIGDVVLERDQEWSPALALLTTAIWITGVAYIAVLYDTVN